MTQFFCYLALFICYLLPVLRFLLSLLSRASIYCFYLQYAVKVCRKLASEHLIVLSVHIATNLNLNKLKPERF